MGGARFECTSDRSGWRGGCCRCRGLRGWTGIPHRVLWRSSTCASNSATIGDGALDVAVGIGVVLPTGSAAYAGEGGIGIEPAIYLSSKGLLTAHFNAGYRHREDATIETLTISDEVFWSFAATVDLIGMRGEAFTAHSANSMVERQPKSLLVWAPTKILWL